MNRFTLMCDNPYTTCIRAERELNKLMGEVDKLRQVKDRLLEENTRLQAERDKAVEDMKSIVNNVREEHSDETCCFACKFDCDTSITDSGIHACECPGFERDDCFEWRGLEETE